MTVNELIERLQQMNPEQEVYFAYDYGDRINTTVAQSIGDVEEHALAYSEYHSSNKVVDADSERDRDRETTQATVISSEPIWF
jgi:hypothetical protein